jgi:hypothetical protein
MKQKIADGITQWLREEAPYVIKLSMNREQFEGLLQTICNQFTADDFEQSK